MSPPASASGDSQSEGWMQEDREQIAGVREGQILAGKYRVERFLAVGGMGAVVAAHHLQLDTTVAIKFLLPNMLGSEEAVARFAREARAAVKITNEHVARVFDVGTLETGAPFIVMEFLHGADLATLLQQEGPFECEEGIEFVLQACEAVAEAHGLSIVHRDLKPANMFCIRRADGRKIIKVLDFGISKIANLTSSAHNIAITRAAAMMGTPLYMSPEQIQTPHTVDARTDIWALGVILYELLTGKMPFHGDTLPEVSLKIVLRPPPPLGDLRPRTPDGLEAVIFRCLEKDRQKRYRNVAQLALALLPFGPERAKASEQRIRDLAQEAGLSSTVSTNPPPPSETIAPVGRTTPTPPTGKKAVLRMLAAAGALAAVAAIAFALTSRRPRASSAASPPTTPSVPASTPETPNEPKAAEIVTLALPPAAPVLDSAPHAPAGPFRPPVSGTQATRSGHAMYNPPHEPKTATAGPNPRLAAAGAAAMTTVASPPGATVTKPGCDPNFFLDDQGRKHFKPECWMTPTAAPAVGSVKTEAGCDPNFLLDDQGRKHFKPECFSNQKP